jgi:HSP20 family protein
LTEPWWRRKKKKAPWLNDIYEELEKLGDLIDETIQKAFETSSEKTPIHRSPIQGFFIKMGPDGKVRIQEFNKRKLQPKKTKKFKELEPLVDFIENDETLVVLAALPGVKRDAINIRTTKNKLTISVDTPNLEYHKDLKLPAKVDPKSACASCKNGVLKVKLRKAKRSVKDEKLSIEN